MNLPAVLCKTDKGREKVRNRSDRIDPRCCCLLLLVDGKTPAQELMGLFAAVGFQQKVALTSSLNDLRKLRQQMVDAITKSKGESFARGMAAELDRLLDQ